MPRDQRPLTILLADDDPDDQFLCKKALTAIGYVSNLLFVEDGEELLDYLRQSGKYAAGKQQSPRPDLILLDLNMPKKDGREALKEIKKDPDLKDIPVVIFTTSKAASDIRATYELGANSFITKPLAFNGLLEVMRSICQYWFEIVALPRDPNLKTSYRR